MNKSKMATLFLTTVLILALPHSFFFVVSPNLTIPPLYNVDAIAVWSHNTSDPLLGRDIYYSIYDDSRGFWWTMEYPYIGMVSPIAKLDGDDLFPAIAFDHNGKAIAVWSHDTLTDSLLFDIYYSCWDPWLSTWTKPAPVNSTFGNDWDPTITLWTDGTHGLVVWTRENGELWYSGWNGTRWIGPSTPLVEPWPPLYPGYLKQPEIAYDANHNAIVVWTDSDEEPPYMFQVWYSVCPYIVPDGLWSYPKLIPGQVYSDVARKFRKGISPDGLGRAKAVWGPEAEFSWPIQYTYWNGSGFNPAFNVTEDTWGIESAIAFDRANNAITTYRSDIVCRQGDIWYNREVAGTWSPPRFAAGTKDNGMDMNDDEPRIAFMLSGKAVAVWTAYYPDTEIYYSIWKPPGFWTKPAIIASAIKHLPGDDGLWDGPVAIASNSGSPTAPVPPMPPQRVDAIAVWAHETRTITNLFDIYYSIYDDVAGVWWTLEGNEAAPIASLAGNDTCPAISFDHHGRAIAVWAHETGGGYHDIYYSRWTGEAGITPGWTKPAPVAETVDVDDLDPAIALWKDGSEAIVVWVAYIPKGIPELWWSQWNGTHWTPPIPITYPDKWPPELDVLDKKPEIAYDAERTAVTIWTEVGTCEYDRVFYSFRRFMARRWSWPREIDGQTVLANVVHRKAISPDRLGNAKAVWGVDTCWVIQCSLWDGIAFGPPSNITKEAIDLQSEPTVAFDQTDNATLVYHSQQLCWDNLWYSREVRGEWTPPTSAADVGGSGTPDTDPRIAHILCGKAITVWTAVHWEEPLEEMYYSVWDPLLNWTVAMRIVSAGLPGADISVAIASNLGSPTTPIAVHDVAVTFVRSNKRFVGQGFNATIYVSVMNEGGMTETFDVEAFYFSTEVPVIPVVIGVQTVTLESGATTTLTFKWNTRDVPKGNYTIGAYATPVPGETDTADNTHIDSTVLVTIPGDVNGDRIVDMKDIYAIILCFGSKIGQPRYDPNCDVNCDGVIDMKDIFIAIRNYGQKW